MSEMTPLIDTPSETCWMRFFCRIRVREELDSHWTDWLGGLSLTAEAGSGSILQGELPDQAALYGLLLKLRDLNLSLASVDVIEESRP